MCNYEKYISANRLTQTGFTCNSCGNGSSMNEKCVSSIFNQLEINFKREVSFDWNLNRYYDFYIPSKNMIVEVHGEQHYKQPTGNWGNLSCTIKNDELKNEIDINIKSK